MTETRTIWDPLPDNPTLKSICIGLFILGACIIGIHTRLTFSLASLWPANALLLSILLLRPEANRTLTWVVVAAAYMAADLLAGSGFAMSAILNGANLFGVAVGLGAARTIPRDVLLLRRPMDSIYIVFVLAAASVGAGVAGVVAGPLLFGMEPMRALDLWFTTEFVNYAIFVPVAMTLAVRTSGASVPAQPGDGYDWQWGAAIISLMASVAFIHVNGGPGAIAFTIPALLWCAVCLPPTVSTALTMATAVWLLIAGPTGSIAFNFDLTDPANISSYRLGVAMIATGPFAVAGLNAAWRVANEALEMAATRDELSGLHNRRSFMDHAQKALTRRDARSFCLLMIDIDHFKAINDIHGHPAGDAVIRAIGALLVENLRTGDIAGRLGGEEFAVGLSSTTPDAAERAAERIRNSVSQMSVPGFSEADLRITVSIGVSDVQDSVDLGTMLSAADSALYVAKRTGRDRVVSAFHGAPTEAALSAV